MCKVAYAPKLFMHLLFFQVCAVNKHLPLFLFSSLAQVLRKNYTNNALRPSICMRSKKRQMQIQKKVEQELMKVGRDSGQRFDDGCNVA